DGGSLRLLGKVLANPLDLLIQQPRYAVSALNSTNAEPSGSVGRPVNGRAEQAGGLSNRDQGLFCGEHVRILPSCENLLCYSLAVNPKLFRTSCRTESKPVLGERTPRR